MKTFGTVAIAWLALSSLVQAQNGPTANEFHEEMFGHSNKKLELRNGLVFEKSSNEPFSGVVHDDGILTYRYVDGVLEYVKIDSDTGRELDRTVLIDGSRIIRQISYGSQYESDDIYKTYDYFEINGKNFEHILNTWVNALSDLPVPTAEELKIEPSGFVYAQWYSSSQMKRGIRYVDGNCCLMTAWYDNGQKEFEYLFVDGRPSVATTWDKDEDAVPSNSEPAGRQTGPTKAPADSTQETNAPQVSITDQVEQGLHLAGSAKAAVVSYYFDTGQWPPVDMTAELIAAESINGEFVESVVIDPNGKIVIHFGNGADKDLLGKSLVLSGTVVHNSIAWECGSNDIDGAILQSVCR